MLENYGPSSTSTEENPSEDLPTRSNISDHQLEYLYKEFRRHIKKHGATKLPTRSEFKGVVVMLGVGSDTSSVDKMLAHLKGMWTLVEESAS